MPEPLQVTQTPSPAPVDTPNIITNLNTDTGPQASPNSFGPDLMGLAQGLDAAGQDIQTTLYRTRFDRRETQQAQNELTSLAAVNDLDKKYTAMQQNARAAGQPIDADQFDSALQTDIAAKADSMPNVETRASFMARATNLGLGFYKNNLVQTADYNQKARAQQFSDVANSLYQQVKSGALTLDDGQDRLMKLGASLAPASGAVPGITSQVSSDMVSATVQNIAQTHGAGLAALTVRNGIGGDAIQEPHREILASELDGQQIIANVTRARIAQQNVDALAQKASAGGFVSNADTLAASKELAAATTAKPVDTNAPDLADYLQGRADHLNTLASSLKGP